MGDNDSTPTGDSIQRLSSEDAYRALANNEEWVVEKDHIYRDFRLKDFRAGVEFIRQVADIAEGVGHHPNILLHEYRFVRVTSYTHLTNSISEKDIELAQAIDASLGRA